MLSATLTCALRLPGWQQERFDVQEGCGLRHRQGTHCRVSAHAASVAALTNLHNTPVDGLQAFADEIGIPFLETSAKNATNVGEAFMTMAAEIKKRMASQPALNTGARNTVRPGEGRPVQAKSSCC